MSTMTPTEFRQELDEGLTAMRRAIRKLRASAMIMPTAVCDLNMVMICDRMLELTDKLEAAGTKALSDVLSMDTERSE